MIVHVNNVLELIRAVDDYATHEERELTTPLVLILHTAGNYAHRFIIGKHGIEKQHCDMKGEPL